MTEAAVTRFALLEPMPWKNGLGTTTQLAIYPPDATLADFAWRVSIARLDADAPFSQFEDVDRCLAVLKGELRLDGLPEPLRLTAASPPVQFSGSVPVNSIVVHGPVLDLNVMCRRSRWSVVMNRIQRAAGTTVRLAPNQLLCSLARRIDLAVAGEMLELGKYDLLHGHEAVTMIVGAAALDAYLIELVQVTAD